MLNLTNEQLLICIADESGFVDWYVERFMPEHLPEFVGLFPQEKLKDMIRRGRRIALRKRFTDPASQVHFVTLMWRVGANFFQMPGFSAIADDFSDTPSSRIDRFYAVPSDLAAEAILAADDQVWFWDEGEIGASAP